MSGTVAALSIGAFSLAVDAIAGDQSVSLGDFVFDGWEIPEHIRWGGHQKMTVHKLVGGQRVIDVMGRDDADISWSAILLSPDASLRADELDQMRVAGTEIPLIFAGRYYNVVISSFQADQRKPWHVPYTITCAVRSDASAVGAETSPLAQVLNDVEAALSYVSTGLTVAYTATAVVQSILPGQVSISPGSAGTIALAGGLAAASLAVGGAAAIADASIAGVVATTALAGNLTGATDVAGALAAMTALSAATADAANAAAMGGYVNRAIANVAEG